MGPYDPQYPVLMKKKMAAAVSASPQLFYNQKSKRYLLVQ